MYATTREFLDYFNLKTLDQLPPLADVKDLETMTSALPLEEFHDARGDDAESEGAQSDGRAESVEGDSGFEAREDGELETSVALNQGIAVEALDEDDDVEVDKQ